MPVAAFDAVDAATKSPVVITRSSVSDGGSPEEVVLVGFEPDGLGAPQVVEGRAPDAEGEVALDRSLDIDVGADITVSGEPFTVVGLTDKTTVLAGIPFAYLVLPEAQVLAFTSTDVISSVLVAGDLGSLPDGLVSLSSDAVVAQTLQPLEGAIASIDLVRALLWIVAAIIVGAVVYLSALDRQRDFAVLKAVGASNGSLLGSLALQAVLIALGAVALAAIIQVFLAPQFPLPVTRADQGVLAVAAVGGGDGARRWGDRHAQGAQIRSVASIRGGSMTVGPLIVSDLVVEFVHDGYAIRPLDGLSFEAQSGELVVLLGPSGCGKTTLLSCLGGILTPTSGSILMGDTDVTAMKGKRLDAYRRDEIGFVFQAFNLIPSLTARENIAVPLTLTGHGRKESFARADELLEQVGLADRGGHLPSKLSGGQMQRVAVARGLGHNPPLLLADEPTANLDHIQAEAIIRVLQSLRDDGRMIVVSTHDSRLVPIADRIVQMVPVGGHDEVPTHDVTYAAGESVFEQEDPSELVYVVKSGEVDVIRVLADGGEELLTKLGPDQYFGELGPFLGFPRSASVRAHTDVVLTAYSPRVFREKVLHKT